MVLMAQGTNNLLLQCKLRAQIQAPRMTNFRHRAMAITWHPKASLILMSAMAPILISAVPLTQVVATAVISSQLAGPWHLFQPVQPQAMPWDPLPDTLNRVIMNHATASHSAHACTPRAGPCSDATGNTRQQLSLGVVKPVATAIPAGLQYTYTCIHLAAQGCLVGHSAQPAEPSKAAAALRSYPKGASDCLKQPARRYTCPSH